MSTWPLDSREVDWAMAHASALVERLASGATADPPAPEPEDEPTEPADDQDSPDGTTDSDVTVHCDEVLPIVNTTFDQSTSER
jgi:hypothetical protein